MTITNETLQPIIRAAISTSDVPTENIRFSELPPAVTKTQNYIRFAYENLGSNDVDILGMLRDNNYRVEIEFLSLDKPKLHTMANTMVEAMYTEYDSNLTEHSGDQELTFDEDLQMYSIIISFNISII